MTLLDELEADSKSPSAGCVVCSWIEGRDDADDWDAAMAASKARITTKAILRAMTKRGYTHSDTPVRRHRTEGHRVVAS